MMNRTRPDDSRGPSRQGGQAARAKALFDLGRLLATPAALAHLAAHAVSPADLLRKHQTGEWGDLGAEDKAANTSALKVGDRILSAYQVAGERIYVITEAETDSRQRSATTLLLATEY